MYLSGSQRKELQDALIDAFPNTASLEEMLTFKLDKNLKAIAGEGSLQEIVFKLIQAANSQGWVRDLLGAAMNSNSGNPLLNYIAQKLSLNNLQQFNRDSNISMEKILILGAIPNGLHIDQEIREIEDAIRRASKRELFEIKFRIAVRPQDIRRVIAEEKPKIVHFCGHGDKDGSLILEDDRGYNKSVEPESFASLFKLHAKYVKCVVINACNSEQTAIAISQYIDYVIGMNNTIQDQAAIKFAQGFYDGLGYPNSDNQNVFQRAFDEGIVAIKMENSSQGTIPVLLENPTLDGPNPVFPRRLAVIVGVGIITTGTIFSTDLFSNQEAQKIENQPANPIPTKITPTPEPSQESTSTVEDYAREGRKQYNLGNKSKNSMDSEASQHYNEAIQLYNEAIKLNRNEAEYYYYRGRARWELNNYKGAIEDCTQAIKLESDNAKYYHFCGLAKRKIKNDEGAIENFKKAIDLSKEKGDEELRKNAQKQLDGICKNSKVTLEGCKTN